MQRLSFAFLRVFLCFIALTVAIFSFTYPSQATENIKYTYDDQGRLWKVAYLNSKVTYEFKYDPSGNRTMHEIKGLGAVLRLWNTRVLEGGALTFGVWLTKPVQSEVSVGWEVFSKDGAANQATAGDDYVQSLGKVTFPKGAREVTISIATIDDLIIEKPERVFVRLVNPEGAPLDPDPAYFEKIGTIRDNDGLYFEVNDASIKEGDFAALTVERKGIMAGTVTVDIDTSTILSADVPGEGNGATSGTDFDPSILGSNNLPLPGNQLVFAPNETSKLIYVKTLADDMHELDEYFHVNFRWTHNDVPGWERSAITMPNDDPIPTINIGKTGNREGANADFAVWLSNPTDRAIPVVYNVSSSGSNVEGYPNATFGVDYTTQGASVSGSSNAPTINGGTISHTLESGSKGVTLSIPLIDDKDIEDNFEAFYVSIVSAGELTINADKQIARGRIRDDDIAVKMSASKVTVDEGDTTANRIVIPVTLNGPGIGSPDTVVDWAITGGSAVHGTHFTGEKIGQLKVPFGATETELVFNTVPNKAYDSTDRTIQVTFSNWKDATWEGSTRILATIRNDDAQPPTFAASGMNAPENVVDRTFTITRSGAIASAATVDYAITAGSAEKDVDWRAKAGHSLSGTLSFNANETSKTVQVQAINDSIWEQRETVTLTLSNPSAGAVIETAVAEVGIGNDDGQPIINVFNNSQNEGNINNNMPMTIFLQGGTSQPVTITYKTTDGSAKAGEDYIAIPASTVTIQPGSFQHDFNVVIIGDTDTESNEEFTVEIVSATGAQIVGSDVSVKDDKMGTNGVGTIVNDDVPLTFAVSGMNAPENVVDRTFTITRKGNTAVAASVNYAITAGSATKDVDWRAKAGHALSGTLSFNANETSKTVQIEAINDAIWEQRETVVLTLSAPSSGAVIGTAVGEVGIGNDDGQPVVKAFNNRQAEGNSNNGMTMSIFLQGGTVQPVTVTYRTEDGSAIAGQDYVAVPATTVTIPAGSFQHDFIVEIIGDSSQESDETFTVKILSTTNASSSIDGVGTILNDDTPPPQTRTYSYSAWSGWQGACGGIQTRTRTVTCTWSPSGNSCGTTIETGSRTCNVRTYSNGPVSWGACSSGGTQTGTYTRTCTWSPSGASCGSSVHSTSRACTPPRPSYTYSWQTGAWSAWRCTGIGNLEGRSRSATCRRSDGAAVAGSHCGGMPSTYETRSNYFCSGGGFQP